MLDLTVSVAYFTFNLIFFLIIPNFVLINVIRFNPVFIFCTRGEGEEFVFVIYVVVSLVVNL